MKLRILSLILVLALLMSCAASAEDAVRIGVMSGPTGMGMAQLMSAENADYTFEIYSAPTNATADLASGALDMLCLPTNTAANLACSKDDFVTVLAVNCLGSLYLLTDADTTVTSVADLDGQTVWASVATSTTGPILEHIFSENGVQVNIEWEADHDALIARLSQGNIHIAVLPEPKATVAMAQNEGWSIALNISEEWDRVCELQLPMGCIVVTNSFLAERPEAVARFLTDYSASIAFIGAEENLDASADMIANAGVLPNAGVAKKALSHLYGSIVCLTGNEMKAALQGFYEIIGQQQPGDAFYYGAE